MNQDAQKPPGLWGGADWPAWVLVLGGWAAVSLAHLYWWNQSLRPLAWDQSAHTLLSLRYIEALQSPLTWPDICSVSIFYPPLFHLSQAFTFMTTGPSLQYAAGVNIFWLLVLMVAVWLLGREVYGRVQGVLAAWLTALVPISAGLTRHVLIEICLAAVVAWTIVVLYRSAYLRKRKALYGLGLLGGLGLLAKWTYPLAVAAPYLYLLWEGRGRRLDRKGMGLGLLICLLLSLPWYLHSPVTLIERLFANAGEVAVQEGDPAVFSLKGWLYYPERLVNDHLFLGLCLFVLAGVIFSLPKRREGSSLILAWFLGGLLLITLVGNKDSRYMYPFIPAACLLAVGWLGELKAGWLRFGLGGIVLALGLWAFLGTSFGIDWLATERAISLAGQPLRVSGRAAGYSGPPIRKNWAVPDLLAAVIEDWGQTPGRPSVGSPASLPRFHKGALASWAAIKGLPVRVESSLDPTDLAFSHAPDDTARIRDRLAGLDYIILKSGEVTLAQGELNPRPCVDCPANPPAFVLDALPQARLVASFPLPDGSRAFLFRLKRH